MTKRPLVIHGFKCKIKSEYDKILVQVYTKFCGIWIPNGVVTFRDECVKNIDSLSLEEVYDYYHTAISKWINYTKMKRRADKEFEDFRKKNN